MPQYGSYWGRRSAPTRGYNRPYAAKRKAGISRKRFIQHIRQAGTALGTGTFQQNTIQTPVGRATNLAMAIHKIAFYASYVAGEYGADGYCTMVLMKKSCAAIPTPDDPNIIAWAQLQAELTTSGLAVYRFPIEIEKRIPEMCANQSIYFCIQNATGQTVTFTVDLEYTLEVVSTTDLLESLVNTQ